MNSAPWHVLLRAGDNQLNIFLLNVLTLYRVSDPYYEKGTCFLFKKVSFELSESHQTFVSAVVNQHKSSRDENPVFQ